jgi:hypothetical protein
MKNDALAENYLWTIQTSREAHHQKDKEWQKAKECRLHPRDKGKGGRGAGQ